MRAIFRGRTGVRGREPAQRLEREAVNGGPALTCCSLLLLDLFRSDRQRREGRKAQLASRATMVLLLSALRCRVVSRSRRLQRALVEAEGQPSNGKGRGSAVVA